MLKKVKQRHYKSKKEFKDDMDLIWSNCYTYNATEVSGVKTGGHHSVEQCVTPKEHGCCESLISR